MKSEVMLSDADVKSRLLAYLREHGPTRTKSLAKRAGTPYERSVRILEALRTAGDVEQVPGGSFRGLPTLAWAITGDTRTQTGTIRFTFGANDTLAAMQAAARTALIRRAA
jgi:predicted ArsR family transcriptional regulator